MNRTLTATLPCQKIKLLCVDLDGTLLQFHNRLALYSVDALNRFMIVNDAEVIIVTGRAVFNTWPIVKELNQHLVKQVRYAICFNGGMIYDFFEEKVLFESRVNAELSLKIFKLCREKKMIFLGYPHFLPDWKTYTLINKNFYTKIISIFKRKRVKFIKELNSNCEFQKIIIVNLSKKKAKACFIWLKQHLGQDLEICWTHRRVFEITAKNVTKGIGVEFFRKKFGLEKNQIAAIGNSNNDLPMFSCAGYNIAMYYSPERLRKEAQLVTSWKRKKAFGDAIDKIIDYQSK